MEMVAMMQLKEEASLKQEISMNPQTNQCTIYGKIPREPFVRNLESNRQTDLQVCTYLANPRVDIHCETLDKATKRPDWEHMIPASSIIGQQ